MSDQDSNEQITRQLAEADFSAESRIRETLRRALHDESRSGSQQLVILETETNQETSTMIPIPKRSIARLLFDVAAAVAVFALVVFAVPPLRTLAEEIITRIGGYIITDAPTPNEIPQESRLPVQIITPPSETPISFGMYMSATEIQAESGMMLYAPTKLPKDFRMGSRSTTQYAGVTTILSQYNFRQNSWNTNWEMPDEDAVHLIWLSQDRFSEDVMREFRVGNADVQKVIVRGFPGIWIADVDYGPFESWLMWEEDGYVFQMSSDGLTLEQTLEVADSMVKITPEDEIGQIVSLDPFQLAVHSDKPIYQPYQSRPNGYRVTVLPPGHNPVHEIAVDAVEVTNIFSAFIGSENSIVFLYQSFDPDAYDHLTEGLTGDALTVRGVTGLWVDDAPLRLEYPDLPDTYATETESGWQMLTWKQDDITFAIQSDNDTITQEELVSFAEGLLPLTPPQLPPQETVAGNVAFAEKSAIENAVGFEQYVWNNAEPGLLWRYGYAVASTNPPTTVAYYEGGGERLIGKRLLFQSVAPLPVEPARNFTLPEAQTVTIPREDASISATYYEGVVMPILRTGQPPLLQYWNVLTWEMDGYYFRLQSNTDQAEMLSIAAALTTEENAE